MGHLKKQSLHSNPRYNPALSQVVKNKHADSQKMLIQYLFLPQIGESFMEVLLKISSYDYYHDQLQNSLATRKT